MCVCVCVLRGGQRKLRTNPVKLQISYSVSTRTEFRADFIRHKFPLHIFVIGELFIKIIFVIYLMLLLSVVCYLRTESL